MTSFNDLNNINDYLRREVDDEETYARSYEIDAYTKIVYRRLRELYWTVSRVLPVKKAAFVARSKANTASAGESVKRLNFSLAAMRPEGPRIFIDATDMLRVDKGTGIQRVVREISRNAAELGLGLPVAIKDGRLVSACQGGPESLEYRQGDILLLLDAGWNRLDDYPRLIRDFRSKGGVVVACLYDLFPLLYPTLYSRRLVAEFQGWIGGVVVNCDGVVAISRSSAESFSNYLKVIRSKPPEGMRLGWWRLGANIEQRSTEDASPAVEAIARQAPYFLSVGTLEMRKGYPVALQAFEKLWAEGVEANFVIVGRSGWNAAAFEDRLKQHPQLGRRLFWLDDASDADLPFLYKNARAVILATFAEGFGLPLVEAAQYGAPVIASDIDVFHEVGGEGVNYFNLLDAGSLADAVKESLAGKGKSGEITHTSWRDSTVELMTMLRSGAYQMKIG